MIRSKSSSSLAENRLLYRAGFGHLVFVAFQQAAQCGADNSLIFDNEFCASGVTSCVPTTQHTTPVRPVQQSALTAVPASSCLSHQGGAVVAVASCRLTRVPGLGDPAAGAGDGYRAAHVLHDAEHQRQAEPGAPARVLVV